VEECIQAGAKDFIIKPFKPSKVVEVMRSVLKER
jgi:DNA-binding response OmpR family regulator